VPREELEIGFRADGASLEALERRLAHVFENAVRQMQTGARGTGMSGGGAGAAVSTPGAPPGGSSLGAGRFTPGKTKDEDSKFATFWSDAARGAGAGVGSLNPAALSVPAAVGNAAAFGAGHAGIQAGAQLIGGAIGGPAGAAVGGVLGSVAGAAFNKLEQDVRAPVERSAGRLGAIAGSLGAAGVNVSDADLQLAAVAINRQERMRYDAEQRGQRFAYEVGYGGSSIQLGLSRLGL
jgi:hypothetical protein